MLDDEFRLGDIVRIQHGLVTRGLLPVEWKALEGRLTCIMRLLSPGKFYMSLPEGVELHTPEGSRVEDLIGHPGVIDVPFSAGDMAMARLDGALLSDARLVTIVRPVAGVPAGRTSTGRRAWVCNDGRIWRDHELFDVVKVTQKPPSVCRFHDQSTGITIPAPQLLSSPPDDHFVARQESEIILQGPGARLLATVQSSIREWPVCPMQRGDPALDLTYRENREAKTITGLWRCGYCSRTT